MLPKHLEPDLVLLRDPKLREHGEATLAELAARVTDRNFRLFAERGQLHVINGKMHLQGTDPFELFAADAAARGDRPGPRLLPRLRDGQGGDGADAGQELRQDQALRWGF